VSTISWTEEVGRRANALDRPGTAMLFALTIVEVMLGGQKKDEVAGPMVVAETL
jgi:hypothetical protein